MRLRPKNRRDHSFSHASMADMVFNLLLFFMLSTSIVNPLGIKINLPQSSTAPVLHEKVAVTITAKDEFFVNQQAVPLENLLSVLKAELSQVPKEEQVIILRAEKNVIIDKVVEVMDIVNQLGAKMVIATEKKSK